MLAATPKVVAVHKDLTGSEWQAHGLLGKAKCLWLTVAVQNQKTAVTPKVCAVHTDLTGSDWQALGVLTAQCCCAKQADSRLETQQIQLWRFGLHTGVQWPNNSAVPHCFWQNTNGHCSVLLCNTGRQQACDTANTAMEIWSSYRCAVAQHQCNATLLLAKCNGHCSVLLCKTG